MTQTRQLVDALKKCLRARGITYRELAGLIGVSEATIKRNFSETSFTLERLEAICRALEMNFYELARMTKMQDPDSRRELSVAQERELAADPVLLTCLYLLLTDWSPTRIARRLGIDRQQSDAYLDRLQELKIVERLPRNRVRLRVGPHLEWRKGGPIRRLYEQRVKAEFLQYGFREDDGAAMKLETGELSATSIAMLRRRMDQIAADFIEFSDLDRALPAEQKTAYAVLLAARPWTYWHLVEDRLPARK
ncbi:MAG: helix-turn-helix transcriptional regulator [Woeseiaceae bacterium]|nr:helix-turn-helix transcriptional regulator [Woeseiaceae bacterium]